MKRAELRDQIEATDQWDVIIIGGGATGLGAAVDAATRGYKTLVLEAYDFAKGTSSRSTKLVHGGVRYLAQGNITLVRDALRERGLLIRNAPHLSHSLPFLVPLYKWWEAGWYGTGLTLYDVLAGKLGIGRSKLVGHGEAIRLVPTLERDHLYGGVVYYDGQFDDSRLAISLMRTLLDHGGVALNYAHVTGLIKTNGRISGVRVRDDETGDEWESHGKVVINATGVFVDTIRHMDEPTAKPMVSPSQGIHLVLDRSFLPGDHAIMVPKTDDGRVLFIIPWHNKALVGTTDTPRSDIPIEPRPMEDEIAFVMEHAARYLTKDPQKSDVLSIFAGLRPLVKAGSGPTSALSRDHTIAVSDAGLITVTGGKWTTYRKMGEDAIDRAQHVGDLPKRPSVTPSLQLHGATDQPDYEPFKVYGSDANALRNLLAQEPGWAQPLHPDLPYRVGEVVWGARCELARTVEDVLSRRTRALLLNARASKEVAPRVAELLAHELGHDEAWQQRQVEEFSTLADQYILA